MQTIYTTSYNPIHSLSDLMEGLQKAAQLHSYDLNIHFDRMLNDFDCLWMIARAKLQLSRLPKGEVRIETWLRSPSSAASIRDYSIFEGEEEIGTAVYVWTLVDAQERKIVSMKQILPVMQAPVRFPERKETVKRLSLPEELSSMGLWQVSKEEIDSNGHVNNVNYIRHAEALYPGSLALEVAFDRECFAGETIQLYGNEGFVCGKKDNGEECFRARFGRNL